MLWTDIKVTGSQLIALNDKVIHLNIKCLKISNNIKKNDADKHDEN